MEGETHAELEQVDECRLCPYSVQYPQEVAQLKPQHFEHGKPLYSEQRKEEKVCSDLER